MIAGAANHGSLLAMLAIVGIFTLWIALLMAACTIAHKRNSGKYLTANHEEER
jgi:hypothetical protein